MFYPNGGVFTRPSQNRLLTDDLTGCKVESSLGFVYTRQRLLINSFLLCFLTTERILDMFLPTPHDTKDAISKYAGFFGMVVSIAFAFNLILSAGGALSKSATIFVSILIGICLGWLSFAVKSKK